MRIRSLAIGLTLLTSGVVVGAATQQFASADVSSGERPVFVPIDTCRITDTRPAPNNVGPRTSPLGAADTMEIDAQQTGTDCTGDIPAGATALSLNVSAINATSNSFITIWPDGERPTASSLNPSPGGLVFNAVTVELAGDQTFQVFNNRGSVNVFVDVNGYYENHNHDDRYDTKAQVDTKIAEATEAISVVSGTDGSRPNPLFTNAYGAIGASPTITTTTTGHLVLDVFIARNVNCGFSSDREWYYITVDGVPVPSSAQRRSDFVFDPLHYHGITDDSYPPGTYAIDIGVECEDPDDLLVSQISGDGGRKTVNVLVVP
ncbi:MAG: hypothetical protein AB8G14_04750 [Ilumatobacter sp.]